MGGWDSTVTQNTVITPDVVKSALTNMQIVIEQFNRYLNARLIPAITMGAPTGSSAYHDVDDADKVYGDIDLQIIVPDATQTDGLSSAKMQTFWHELFDDFIQTATPEYVHPESNTGHPFIGIGDNKWVQVDMMVQPVNMKHWGQFRVTPEHGVKGSLTGNMFSVLGELLDMSIQHNGVQLKIRDNVRVPFSKHKDVELKTISTDIETFVRDIFDYEYKNILNKDPIIATIDSKLDTNAGINVNDIKIKDLVNATKGLANSFEINGMYGAGSLTKFRSSPDFLSKFLIRYEEKAMIDINSKKRDKAQTPNAKLRAQADRDKVTIGLKMVKELF